MGLAISRSGANLAGGVFVPQIYSAKAQAKFYASSVVAQIANTKWEGDIKGGGDKVIIRKVPTINIFDHIVGQNHPVQDVTDESITLLIDKAKGYTFVVPTVDEKQSDMDLINILTSDASEQMKVVVDQSVLQSVYSDVALANTVDWSGSAVRLGAGTTGIPLATLTAANALEPLFFAAQALDNQNVPADGRWAVVSPQYANYLKRSDLKQVLTTGDSKSPLRSGLIGEINGMKIYASTNLKNAVGATSGAPTEVLVGHTEAIAFASQFMLPEVLPNPFSFGTMCRGLKVYGFKTVKAEALARVLVY